MAEQVQVQANERIDGLLAEIKEAAENAALSLQVRLHAGVSSLTHLMPLQACLKLSKPMGLAETRAYH